MKKDGTLPFGSLFGHEKHTQISQKKGGVFKKLNFEQSTFFGFSIYLKNYSSYLKSEKPHESW